jgi:predicted TIM-barrel fold metal-dependent hydrolase
MLHADRSITRRDALIKAACGFATAAALVGVSSREAHAADETTAQPAEPIIDIHQHTTYHGRSNEALLHHQKRMGVTQTILLPGGRPANSSSTLNGKANGLYAGAGTFETCVPIVRDHPGEYFYAANEVPDLPDARKTLEEQLKAGSICIGEQKFNLPCDSKEMEMVYALAEEYDVPVLMHFQHETFNTGYERFGDVLKKWPKVKFIGHAQTMWANIDANHSDQTVLYPKGKVTPGGWTDRYLTEHRNFFSDMSAGSGLSAMLRDEEHARGFIERHQDQLMYGSDCADPAGFGPTCSGAQMISAIRRLSAHKMVERKLLHDNAAALFTKLK